MEWMAGSWFISNCMGRVLANCEMVISRECGGGLFGRAVENSDILIKDRFSNSAAAHSNPSSATYYLSNLR